MPGEHRQCTAKSKRSQQQCRGWATKGTDKCRMHGGSPRRAMKHGLTSKYGPPPVLAKRIEAYRRDPRLLDHARIAAHMQALADDLLAKVGDDGKLTGDQVESVLPVLAELRKAATDFHRIANDKRFVDLVEARELMRRGLEQVLRHVPEDRREDALRDFGAVIGGAADDLGGAPPSVH